MRKNTPLTAAQMQTLEFISSYQAEKRYAPTIREIAEAFGISIRAAQDRINALKKKQAVMSIARCPRTLQVIRQ